MKGPVHSRQLLRSAAHGLAAVLAFACLTGRASAQVFTFSNLTDSAGGPGAGSYPSINDHGDVAFTYADTVYLYRRDEATFSNLNALPGAPARGWYPKLNGRGDVAFIDPTTRNLWFYQAATPSLTNVSALSGYPGNSGAHGLNAIFDLNDTAQISFHSGDINYGAVWVYTHATGAFLQVTGRTGAPSRGRENAINDVGRVAYAGFPDIYVFDIASGSTQNITDLPGGPGTGLGSFSFNDRGDVAIFRPSGIIYYHADTGAFLDLTTLPGFPAGSASSSANDISNRGEITFWRDALYYFDPVRRTFTRLNGQNGVPSGGLATSINERGVVALAAGLFGSEDIFLAVLEEPRPPLGLRRSP